MNLRSPSVSKDKVPSSLQTQDKVLTRSEIKELLPALNHADFTRQVATDLPGDHDTDWEVDFTAEDSPVHPVVKKSVLAMIARNKYLQEHLPRQRCPIRRISIVRMEYNAATQPRTRFKPQHQWHKDGDEPLLTMVYTLYDGQWNSSESPGAFQCGGRLGLSDRPCGTALYSGHDHEKFKAVRAGRVVTYYPRTNGVYILPGYIATHSVFRMEKPSSIRYAIVVFLEPRTQYTFQSVRFSADVYLRLTWALGFSSSKHPIFCRLCHRVFDSTRQLSDHQTRQPGCCKAMKKKRKLDALL